jgi:thiamine biosynthesis lipoprotein
MNRREFLDLRQLAHETGQVLDHLKVPPPNPSAEPALLRFGRPAMATNFEVILPFATPRAAEAASDALDRIDQLEDQLTIYRQHSEVSRLNAQAGIEPVPVERNLFDLLLLAQQIHRQTFGAFDVAVGALIKAWGFHARAGRVPQPAELAEARSKTGLQHVLLDPAQRTVSFVRPGLEINLGSIGKGFAVDAAVQTLWKNHQVAAGLVHGGHSSIVAIGSEPGTQEGWPVLLSDPRAPDKSLGLFRLKDRAMGTSAATHQHLLHDGKKLGHILDPRTGWPATGMLGATVTAPTAAVADALATAFFILGPEPARAYCEGHSDIGAVLIAEVPFPTPIVLGRARAEFGV